MAYDANGKGRAQLVHGTILVPALGQPDVTPGAELEGECAMALYLIMYGDAESISFETNEIDVERLQSTLYGLLRRSWDADNRRIEFQDDERQVHRYRPDAWASARAYLVDDDEKDHVLALLTECDVNNWALGEWTDGFRPGAYAFGHVVDVDPEDEREAGDSDNDEADRGDSEVDE